MDGLQTVGWKPCICTPAREAAEEGRGMGHVLISRASCHDKLRSMTFYERPHDIRHRQAGPWLVSWSVATTTAPLGG